ncbi:baseplate assembly protein [Acuticoccus sediminis]|uniref:Baseplate assembly protein n=1 Tax=Acuticoccus sediminis TaxID=2184697 RepID=A0A8B2NXK0_9HYPH|nr:GPW/gp25 family protein [Acuticoccus sediminis]RAI01101.1 baseplate assembly protein [Acuticoccus sediminis]
MADSAGADRVTGAPLTDWSHVLQSIHVILTTPIGSRVMRRDFGSELPALIGQPMTTKTILALYVAAYVALVRWEPRFNLTNVQVSQAGPDGRLGLDLTGEYYPTGHLDRGQVAPVTIPTFTVYI